MIKCHLSKLMGIKKVNVAEVVRQTGLARNTVAGLYHETTTRFDSSVLDTLCRYFNCQVGDLLEFVPDE